MTAFHDTEQTHCPAKTTTRILVIDDDACVSMAIQAILARRQYETVVASRADAGIHTSKASEFDMVIVDLFMPGMNGLDTIAGIRSGSAVPIIAMSGFRLRNSLDTDQDFLAMAMLRGATTSLRKPFSPSQLINAIDQGLGLEVLDRKINAMTQNENRTGGPKYPRWVESSGLQAGELEVGRPSPERTRAANEVGSAIAHQLNGPLTALRLYVGEIREDSSRYRDAAEARDNMQQIVEAAFQETERVCAMMRLIAEQPLYPETATALSRDVISGWSRSGSADGGDPAGAFALLTPREREVLGHVSQGCSNRQGAARMQIGSRTFESHRARLMRKLGARNAADLVRMAFLTRDVG
jgi:DNA-binding NarL/FixJ family response regulator